METPSPKLLFAPWGANNPNYVTYQTFYAPFKELFPNMVVFDPQENLRYFGQDHMRHLFIDLVQKEKPDYLFMWLISDEFNLDTLAKVKEISPHTKMINFFGDDDTLFENHTRFFAPCFDYCFFSQIDYEQKYRAEGIKNYFPLINVDTQCFYPLIQSKQYDVTFIGSPKSDRRELLQFLLNNNINLKLFGYGWDAYPEFTDVYGGALNHQDFLNVISQSKINISFSKNLFGKKHLKSRTFEIMACRSFALIEYFSGYQTIFKEDVDIAMFRSCEELSEKMEFYLAQDVKREEIAAKGYQIVKEKFSVRKQLKTIFSKIVLDMQAPISFPQELLAEKSLVKYLNHEEMTLPQNSLIQLLKTYDFVGFKTRECRHFAYREECQIYALEKSKKAISICDYYVSHPHLGNFLAFDSRIIYETYSLQTFMLGLNINQIITRKDYFIRHLNDFKLASYGDFNKISIKEELTFVSLPLIRIKKTKRTEIKTPNLFIARYENALTALRYQKKLLLNRYGYYLIFYLLVNDRKTLILLIRRGLRKILVRIKSVSSRGFVRGTKPRTGQNF